MNRKLILILIVSSLGWIFTLYLYRKSRKINLKEKHVNILNAEFLEKIFDDGEISVSLDQVAKDMGFVLRKYAEANRTRIFLKMNYPSSDLWFQSKISTLRQADVASQDIIDINSYIEKVNDDVITIDSVKNADQQIYKILVSYKIDVILVIKNGENVFGFVGFSKGDDQRNSDLVCKVKEIKESSELLAALLLSAAQRDILLEENSKLIFENKTIANKNNISLKQIKKLDYAKDEFISMMSHQLRTPLTSIKGYLSLFLEGDLGKMSQSQTKMMNEIYKSTERMNYTINDFLTVSRLQTGRFNLNREISDIKKIAFSEYAKANENAKRIGVDINFKAPNINSSKMNLDVSKITQAIGNLLDNAIYYSASGGKVSLELIENPDRIIISVIDSGESVPQEDVDKMFDKFYRGENAKKARPDGAGIGLYLVKEIALSHGGDAFYNSLDDGNEFGFWLPIDRRLNYNKIQIKE